MEEWKEYSLGEIGKVITGKTPRTAITDNYGGEIPFLSPSDDMTSKFVLKTARYLTEKGLSEVKNCLIPEGAICVSCIGSDMGKSVITKRPTVTNQQINSIILNESFDSNFIYYVMQSKRKEIRFLGGNGTAVPILNKSAFSNLTIFAPERATQLRIASILSSLDDKIAVNKKICDNLEAQAQALFKHWFVDFAPFKDGKFVESELGLIPEGWKVARIKDIPHTLNTGKRPKGGAITSGVPSIGAEQLKGLCNYDYTKTKYISEEFSKSIPKGKVIGYEVYLNRVGGKPGDYIQNTTMFGEGYPYENCYLNDHVFKLDFMQNRRYNVFIYFTFLTSRIQKYLNACGGKAAIPVINKQNIDDIYVFSPENEYVIKFGDSILPMINLIFKIGVESARLATLRDTLLPKLLSGQIKINEVEKSL